MIAVATLAHQRLDHVPAPDAYAAPALLAPPPPRLTDRSGASQTATIARSTDGMFYIGADVNDRPVRFLVDTGASLIVLRRSDAVAIGLNPDAAPTRNLRTAGGRTAMPVLRLDSVAFAGRSLRGLEAAIVDDAMGVSLLGQNALSRLERIAIEGDTLSIG
ncbi:retropepsin-like aspartic protease family protein [Sphingomonas sp.]